MKIIFSKETKSGFIKDIDGKKERYLIEQNLFKKFLVSEIFKVNQIHGNLITINRNGTADGIILTKNNVAATILTADCFSVAIKNKSQNISGIFHCGWRGVVSEILNKGINQIRQNNNDDLIATIFPGIEKCCFEIGMELKEVFEQKHIPLFKIKDKLFADLKTAIKYQLQDLNIFKIEDFSKCTFCNKEFFSYRRDKTKKRHLSFIIN